MILTLIFLGAIISAMSRIAEALREARIAAHITQKDLARLLGVTQAFISLIETGRKPLPPQHYEMLPDPIRVPVAKALVADLRDDIDRAADLMRPKDAGTGR